MVFSQKNYMVLLRKCAISYHPLRRKMCCHPPRGVETRYLP